MNRRFNNQIENAKEVEVEILSKSRSSNGAVVNFLNKRRSINTFWPEYEHVSIGDKVKVYYIEEMDFLAWEKKKEYWSIIFIPAGLISLFIAYKQIQY